MPDFNINLPKGSMKDLEKALKNIDPEKMKAHVKAGFQKAANDILKAAVKAGGMSDFQAATSYAAINSTPTYGKPPLATAWEELKKLKCQVNPSPLTSNAWTEEIHQEIRETERRLPEDFTENRAVVAAGMVRLHRNFELRLHWVELSWLKS